MTTLPHLMQQFEPEKSCILKKSRNLSFRFTRGKGSSLSLLNLFALLMNFSPRSLTYINQNFYFNRCTHLKLSIPSFTSNANPKSKCKMIIMWNISLKPLAVRRKETHLSLFFPSGSNTLVHEQSIWYLYWQGEMCDFKTSSSRAVT